jgi:hypothetical protein
MIAHPIEHMLSHVHHAAGKGDSPSERASFTMNVFRLLMIQTELY